MLMERHIDEGSTEVGWEIRSLRRSREMTQARLADRLGISPSYLNLIEHDRRALTAPLLIKLAQVLDIDLQTFAPDRDERIVADLMEMFGDQIFEGYTLSTVDVREFGCSAPAISRAVLALYQAYTEAKDSAQGMAMRVEEGDDNAGVDSWRLPSEEVGALLQRHMNYFPTLEDAADDLWRNGRLEADDMFHGFVRYLRDEHSIEVRIARGGSDDAALRRYDPHRKQITVAESLAMHDRAFQLAHQVALLTQSTAIDRICEDHRLTTNESRSLCRIVMANYFAAAVLMPYRPFLEQAKAYRYDIERLAHRFATSYEQVCHRLTTLRRQGAEGVPFHFVRVDIAGTISKRFSASGLQMARFSGLCPRWNVHAAFLTPGRIRVQMSQMPDNKTYFCLARTVTARHQGYNAPQGTHVVAIGCDVEQASNLVYADGLDLKNQSAAVPVGSTCRLCPRMNCSQRAFPPLQKVLQIDENVRGPNFYWSAQE